MRRFCAFDRFAAIDLSNQLDGAKTGKAKPRGKSGQKKKANPLEGLYKLPLDLTAGEALALGELRESQNWHAAEMSLIASLRNLFVQFNVKGWKPPMTQEERDAEKAKFNTKTRVKPFVLDDEDVTAQASEKLADCPPCQNPNLCQKADGCVAEL